MLKNIKVSICIPTYNSSKTLQKLLESIITQTYTNYEICISDNSDDDKTIRMIKNFSYLPIKYILNEHNLGATPNWNNAISIASGEYIKVMFSDDWFTYNNSLEKFVAMLENNPEVDLAFSGTMQVSSNAIYSRKINNRKKNLIEKDCKNLFLGNYIGAPSATIWRNKKDLFSEEYKWLVDMELYMRILENNKKFMHIIDPLVSIGISELQLTNEMINNRELCRNEYINIFNTHKLGKYRKHRIFLAEILFKSKTGVKKARILNISSTEYIIGIICYWVKCVKGIFIRIYKRCKYPKNMHRKKGNV